VSKTSLILIVIGFFVLIFAVVLTIIPMLSPILIPNPSNIAYDWFSGIGRAFIIGLIYVVAFVLIVAGLFVAKREDE
jgi:hypothetical protein